MALSCKLNKDLLKGDNCGYVLQSVTNIYLANASEVTFVYGDDKYVVTGVTGGSWYHIEPAKNTASFSDVLNVNDGGFKYRTHSLSFSVTGVYSDELQEALDQLSLGSYVAFAQFASGDAVLLGSPTAGIEATVVTNTGAASASETSGISVEMSADLTNSAYSFTDAEMKAIVGAAEA